MNNQPFETIINSKTKLSRSNLDQFYSTLSPVKLEDMPGKWRGYYIPTGSIFDHFLKKFPAFHWYGKNFITSNKVHALVMNFFGLKWSVPLLGSAVIRNLEFRGKHSVAMIYNYLPIIDHFRKVDDEHIMGIMTVKDRCEVYFYLTRNPDTA